MEHNKTSNPAGQWLDRATEGIRFGPDRKAVRAELDAHLPAAMKRYIAKNDIKFYTIDATHLAKGLGLV